MKSSLPMKVGASMAYTATITVGLAFLYIAVTYDKDGGWFSYDPNSAVMSTDLLKLVLPVLQR